MKEIIACTQNLMTKFLDGPAQGQTLMLKRAAYFLRVTEADGKFDALDQPDDEPRPEEKIHAYHIEGEVGHCHIRCSGKSKRVSGFYVIANYRLCEKQPTDAESRTRAAWVAWCETNAPKQ